MSQFSTILYCLAVLAVADFAVFAVFATFSQYLHHVGNFICPLLLQYLLLASAVFALSQYLTAMSLLILNQQKSNIWERDVTHNWSIPSLTSKAKAKCLEIYPILSELTVHRPLPLMQFSKAMLCICKVRCPFPTFPKNRAFEAKNTAFSRNILFNIFKALRGKLSLCICQQEKVSIYFLTWVFPFDTELFFVNIRDTYESNLIKSSYLLIYGL